MRRIVVVALMIACSAATVLVASPVNAADFRDCYWRLSEPQAVSQGAFNKQNMCNEGDVLVNHALYASPGVQLTAFSYSFVPRVNSHPLPQGILVNGSINGGTGSIELDLLCCPYDSSSVRPAPNNGTPTLSERAPKKGVGKKKTRRPIKNPRNRGNKA